MKATAQMIRLAFLLIFFFFIYSYLKIGSSEKSTKIIIVYFYSVVNSFYIMWHYKKL